MRFSLGYAVHRRRRRPRARGDPAGDRAAARSPPRRSPSPRGDAVQVMVAMSGGVDSSVAAALLADAGHDVTGVTLRLWGGVSDSGCCSVGDVEDARRVAAQLGVPHYVFDEADEFEARVVAPYVRAYDAGATPNPCVACNRELKFGRLLDRARALGFDALATGHHARVRRGADGVVRLAAGPRHREGPVVRALRAHPARAARTSCSRSASSRRPRCGPGRPPSVCARPTSPRAWTCASSPGATGSSSSRPGWGPVRASWSTSTGARSVVTTASPGSPSVSAGAWASRWASGSTCVDVDARTRRRHGRPARRAPARRGARCATSCSRTRRPASRPGARGAGAGPRDAGRRRRSTATSCASPSRRRGWRPGQVVALYDGDELVGGGIAR